MQGATGRACVATRTRVTELVRVDQSPQRTAEPRARSAGQGETQRPEAGTAARQEREVVDPAGARPGPVEGHKEE
eukprot:13568371-Alexandrium_andersonii.AAC.1